MPQGDSEQSSLDDPPPSSLLLTQPPGPLVLGTERGHVFNVCHVGLVLRAVAFVEVAILLGALALATERLQLIMYMGLGTLLGLSGTLLWLTLLCGLRRPLGSLPRPFQWTAVTVLGALCACVGWSVLSAGHIMLPQGGKVFVVMLIGAFIAALLFYWLELRSRAQLPANAMARLVDLQSRIRPHFLFNTLNSAVALVRVDPERAEAVLEDLAELFRVALEDHGPSVSLNEEVQLAQRYLAIEQVRYGSRLNVEWELDPQAGVARVPPLMLQPLIENAVRHGIDPSPEGGTITVRTRGKAGQALIDIVNTRPRRVTSTPGHGIALSNVRERLRLLHDVAAKFEIELDDERFYVRMGVPL